MKRRFILCLVLIGLFAACASVPSQFEQAPSYVWSTPENTRLGAILSGDAPQDTLLSRVHLLSNAREAFRLRYGLAGLAEHTLDLQYYLWKGDLTGRLLLHQAIDAADRGVRVRILIDDIYHSGRDWVYAAVDAHPLIEVRVFNPIGNRGIGRNANFVFNKRALNHRMHNKIFLVDNAAAILGGRNIGDDYFGIDPKLNFRDLEVLAAGPAAREAGAAYDLYWNSSAALPIKVLAKKAAGPAELAELRLNIKDALTNLEDLSYPLPADEDAALEYLKELAETMVWAAAEVVVDPLDRFEGGKESEFLRLGREINEALTHEMVAQTAYLIPTKEGVEALAALTARGITVRILTNSSMSNNHLTVHAHYMKYRKKLLNAGVELYELRADAEMLEHFKETENPVTDSHAGLHTKAFVFDRRISLIGSYNMDPRSRVWNSEIGLLIKGEEFAGLVLNEMVKDFDPANSYRLSLDERGSLKWTGDGPEGDIEWKKEPGASVWRRIGARLFSWLPIENEL